MAKFNYGNFHLKYNMTGDIKIGTGIVKVQDIFDGVPKFMLEADCLFVDPPCSKGNLKSFYTKNELEFHNSYENFNEALFETIKTINPKRVFIEVFKSNKEIVESNLNQIYNKTNTTLSYYYHDKNKKCWIIEATNENLTPLPYLDEQYIIDFICKNVEFNCIADPCMGRGLLGFYANKYKKRFAGTELNKKRLAVLLERINKGKL